MTKHPRRTWGAALTAILCVGAAYLPTIGTSSAQPQDNAVRSLNILRETQAVGADADDPELQQVTLAKGTLEVGEPMSLAVLPDRSVLHTSRDGTLRLTDAQGLTKVAGKLAVYNHDEEGLQGVAVDPGFKDNRRVYLYYAPPLSTPSGGAPDDGTASTFAPFEGVNRLSMYTLKADGTLDAASEKKVIDVPASRGKCCHVGGDIDFDAAGNLYLSTGDDTNPFKSDGYSPIDERPTRDPSFDAQRTSANSNDLRGKVLRIKVSANGSYTVPDGNLFAPGTAKTRPEIYAMGFRNPFRMSVDKKTNAVYLGDYGPDATKADPQRGPRGKVEFNRITAPGFYGWPYCTGANTSADTYTEYNFDSKTAGPKYDCAGGSTNNSPRNTGITKLPPAKAAWISYYDDSVPEFGNGSESPMAGPVYHYDPALASEVKLPASYDGQFFAGEFGRKWIKTIAVKPEGSRGSISPFPWSGTQVMDMAFGPDGALYVLDYGTGSFGGDGNSALHRIEHVTNGRTPNALAKADTTSGIAPVTVRFNGATSSDPDGDALTHAWDFGDKTTSKEVNPTHTYTANGQYSATLKVTDAGGKSHTAAVGITVGNTAPVVSLQLPKDGQLFEFGDEMPYRITVTDAEDATIDCSKVTLTYALGHDTHGHPMASSRGCRGTIKTEKDGEHDADANIYGSWNAEYTDSGANGQPALKSTDQHISQPAVRQAEHYKAAQGVNKIDHSAAHGAKTVGDISNGDWIQFEPYGLDNATTFTARVSSDGAGGTLEMRTGKPTGTLIGSARVPVTGDWNTFQNVTGPLSQVPADARKLFLVFKGGSGSLFDIDEFTFSTGRVVGVGGKCLDVRWRATADGTPVQLYPCNGTPAQHWTVKSDGTLRALGKCLDVAGGATAQDTKVQLWTCNGSAAQQWDQGADNSLLNPRSAKALTVPGSKEKTQLVIQTPNKQPNQQWQLP